MNPGYATFCPMSTTGTESPALARTSSRVPTAVTRPCSMRTASAVGGSSIVTMFPTRTRLPVDVLPAAAEPSGEPLGVASGADGELVLLGLQPVTRASATSAAQNEPDGTRDVVMGQPSSRRRHRTAGPLRRIRVLAEADASTTTGDRG